MWHDVRNGHPLDHPTGALLATIAEQCCDRWRRPDAGIWELEDTRHYTNSKMRCWVALDHAVRLADSGALYTRHAPRWRAERDLINAWVNTHWWSDDQDSYTFCAGAEQLDASTLLAGPTGLSAASAWPARSRFAAS